MYIHTLIYSLVTQSNQCDSLGSGLPIAYLKHCCVGSETKINYSLELLSLMSLRWKQCIRFLFVSTWATIWRCCQWPWSCSDTEKWTMSLLFMLWMLFICYKNIAEKERWNVSWNVMQICALHIRRSDPCKLVTLKHCLVCIPNDDIMAPNALSVNKRKALSIYIDERSVNLKCYLNAPVTPVMTYLYTASRLISFLMNMKI